MIYQGLVTKQSYGGYWFKIEEDFPEVGAYLYVYESGRCIEDWLYDNVKGCMAYAERRFGVPIDAWREDVLERKKLYKTSFGGRDFRIQDQLILGLALYVVENGFVTVTYQIIDVEGCMKVAYERYGVPFDAWQEDDDLLEKK